MHIKELCKISHLAASSKGFWETITCPKCNGASTTKFLKGHKILCLECNNTGKIIKDRNNGELIALIHSELSETLEALRHNNPESDKIKGFTGAEEELADCVIRICDMAEARGWDLEGAIDAKLEYNRGRKHKHGKMF